MREFIEQLGILKNGLGWDMEENYANLWNACADYDNNHRGSYLTGRIQEYDFVDDEIWNISLRRNRLAAYPVCAVLSGIHTTPIYIGSTGTETLPTLIIPTLKI